MRSQPIAFKLCPDLSRHGRVVGGGVDEDHARPRPGDEAARTGERRLHLDAGGDADDDHVARFGERRRILGLGRAAADEIVDRLAVAVAEDGERIALLEDVLRGAVAHQADAEKTDPRPVTHFRPWSRFARRSQSRGGGYQHFGDFWPRGYDGQPVDPLRVAAEHRVALACGQAAEQREADQRQVA